MIELIGCSDNLCIFTMIAPLYAYFVRRHYFDCQSLTTSDHHFTPVVSYTPHCIMLVIYKMYLYIFTIFISGTLRTPTSILSEGNSGQLPLLLLSLIFASFITEAVLDNGLFISTTYLCQPS